MFCVNTICANYVIIVFKHHVDGSESLVRFKLSYGRYVESSNVLGVELHRECFDIFFYGKLQICQAPFGKGNDTLRGIIFELVRTKEE